MMGNFFQKIKLVSLATCRQNWFFSISNILLPSRINQVDSSSFLDFFKSKIVIHSFLNVELQIFYSKTHWSANNLLTKLLIKLLLSFFFFWWVKNREQSTVNFLGHQFNFLWAIDYYQLWYQREQIHIVIWN